MNTIQRHLSGTSGDLYRAVKIYQRLMVREVEGCTVNKKVSSILLRGHGGGLIGSACVLVPGCHANPAGLFYPGPGQDKQTEEKDTGMDARMAEQEARWTGGRRFRIAWRGWGVGRVMDRTQRKVKYREWK